LWETCPREGHLTKGTSKSWEELNKLKKGGKLIQQSIEPEVASVKIQVTEKTSLKGMVDREGTMNKISKKEIKQK